MSSERWSLSVEEKNYYIQAMTKELTPLCVRAGITQGELANLLGISRQTYSAIETGRAEMSWSTYLSLVWFFDNNLETSGRDCK